MDMPRDASVPLPGCWRGGMGAAALPGPAICPKTCVWDGRSHFWKTIITFNSTKQEYWDGKTNLKRQRLDRELRTTSPLIQAASPRGSTSLQSSSPHGSTHRQGLNMQTSTEVHIWHSQPQLPPLLSHQQTPAGSLPAKHPESFTALHFSKGGWRREGVGLKTHKRGNGI